MEGDYGWKDRRKGGEVGERKGENGGEEMEEMRKLKWSRPSSA